MTFTKMNGAGNDFVVMDNRDGSRALTQVQIARLCDRYRGVGADGLMLVEPAESEATAKMRYYNADGGEAEMCGNGARCFARFVNRLHGHRLQELNFETIAGVIGARFPSNDGNGDGDGQGLVCVQLSDPLELRTGQQLGFSGGETRTVHSVNTGVPHAVIFVDEVDAIDLPRLGASLRYHETFAPAGTNANFAEVIDNHTLKIRTYERGVESETLACGTGMAACALLHAQLEGAESPIAVRVAGGDTLSIGFERTADGFRQITLTGPADFVFEGSISLAD